MDKVQYFNPLKSIPSAFPLPCQGRRGSQGKGIYMAIYFYTNKIGITINYQSAQG